MINNKIIHAGHEYTEIITEPDKYGNLTVYNYGNGIFNQVVLAIGLPPIMTSMRMPEDVANDLFKAVINDDHEHIEDFYVINKSLCTVHGTDDIGYELKLYLAGASYFVDEDWTYEYRLRYEEYIDVLHDQHLLDFNLKEDAYYQADRWCRSICSHSGINLNRMNSIYDFIRECRLAYQRISDALWWLVQRVKCIPFGDFAMEYKDTKFFKESKLATDVRKLILDDEYYVYDLLTVLEPYFVNADVGISKIEIEYFLRSCGIELDIIGDDNED